MRTDSVTTNYNKILSLISTFCFQKLFFFFFFQKNKRFCIKLILKKSSKPIQFLRVTYSGSCFKIIQRGTQSSLISSHSLNLDGRRSTTGDVATIHFHHFFSPAALRDLQTPFLSIPWRYLPIFSAVMLLSLSPAELFSPCRRILRGDHAIWAPVSSAWLGDHHALQLHSGFCCEPPRSSHGLCRNCSAVSHSISSQGLGSFPRVHF